MKIVLFCLLLINTLITAYPESTEIYLVLFDVTGSMEGKGDGRGIRVFDKAKEAVKFFVNEIPDDNYLFIYPFHAGLSNNRFQSIIRSGYGKKKAIDYISSLKAEGSNTWITESYRLALQETKDYLRLHRVTASKVNIFFFTDGKGNHLSDADIENFIRVHKDASLDLPLNTRFVAIGDIFLPEEIQRLLNEGIGLYSFQRENFSNINAYMTVGDIDTSGGKVKIPFKIASDPKMNGQNIKYSMKIDQVEENIKPEFSKEQLNSIYNQLQKCNAFDKNEISRLDKFINSGGQLSNDEITRFETKINDCGNVSARDKEKLSKLLKHDYLFTQNQVNKLQMDSVIFSGQGTQISDNRAVDTISINSAKVNEIMDSLFNSALDTNKIKQFLQDKELTGKVFLTQEEAGPGKEDLIMFPDDKIPFAVPLTAKHTAIGKEEKQTMPDKDLFGVPAWMIYILGALLLGAGGFLLIQYYRSQQLKGRTAAYKDADVREFIQGKPEKIDVCLSLSRILKELEPKLDGIQVETKVKSIIVNAYPKSVNYIMKELISNAVDAVGTLMFEPERKITIETFEDAKYGTVRISNTGGIAMDKEGVIFRDRYSTKNNKGFGLIYCHKIITANKGRIRYEGVTKLRRNEVTNINEVVNGATIMTVDFPK